MKKPSKPWTAGKDQQARIRLREGGGTTEAARAIAEAYISRVVAQVPERPSGG